MNISSYKEGDNDGARDLLASWIGTFFCIWIFVEDIYFISAIFFYVGIVSLFYSAKSTIDAYPRFIKELSRHFGPLNSRFPECISPHDADLFDPLNVPQVTEPIPDFSMKLHGALDDAARLRSHMQYLAGVHAGLLPSITPGRNKLEADRAAVRAQQRALVGLGNRGNIWVRKIETQFPKLQTSLVSVPAARAIILPTPPNVPTMQQYEKMQKRRSTAFSNAVTQGARAGGIGGAMLAAAAGVAISVVMIQKQIRKVAILHEEVATFARQTALDQVKLGHEHKELVRLSQEIYEYSQSIGDSLEWIEQAQKEGRFRDNVVLTEREISKLKSLKQYSMLAPAKAFERI